MKKADSEALDKFGELIVTQCRDRGISFTEGLLKGHWRSPSLKTLQARIAELSPAHKRTVKQAVTEAIDTAIHDFLFAIQENSDMDDDIQIIVNGKNIARISDGLHGEAYGDNGWYAKYSKYNKRKG